MAIDHVGHPFFARVHLRADNNLGHPELMPGRVVTSLIAWFRVRTNEPESVELFRLRVFFP
jgi:hypothetical protein